jgi:hypothetical protein
MVSFGDFALVLPTGEVRRHASAPAVHRALVIAHRLQGMDCNGAGRYASVATESVIRV